MDETEKLLRGDTEATCRFRCSEDVSVCRDPLLEAKFTAEHLDLLLHLGKNREVIASEQDVSAVLERREQPKRLLKAVLDASWRLGIGWFT